MSDPKRLAATTPDAVQRGNREWWTRNTMSYEWDVKVKSRRFSLEWYDEIDKRFVSASRLFATEEVPFDRVIPFERLRGARVLEIGCGMGFHTELMIRSGAIVSAVDLSPTSIDATRKRLELKGLTADIRHCDAESLPFEDKAFDFVWSWGVIHHSAHTARIVRQIARVLSPAGEARVMVYNREGAAAWAALLFDYFLRLRFRSRTFDEVLWSKTDGFSARFYVREQFEDLLSGFFGDVSAEVMGQDADAVPLPRLLRRAIVPLLPTTKLRQWQRQRGSFIFARASAPF